jgi:hypothetical protein
MKKLAALLIVALTALSAAVAHAGEAPAAKNTGASERYEVSAVKGVRPTLVRTLAAVQKRDLKAAQAAFDDYDSAWNGIEVYINVRNREMYDVIEHKLQAKITESLKTVNLDWAAITADIQAMLAKYDEAISMIEKGAPLHPLYDDVARLRTVRSHLREVPPALKAGDFAKARKSFDTFDEKWDSIEDLVKARSNEAYVAIESGMIQIDRALTAKEPDVAQATGLVNGVLEKYNAIVAQITREARDASK